MGILRERFVAYVGHAVLCELGGGVGFGLFQHLVLFHFDSETVGEFLLYEVPLHHPEECGELLLDILHRELALVDGIEPLLEELFRHGGVGLLDEEVAYFGGEYVIRFAGEVGGHLFVDVLFQPLFVFYRAVRENHLEELLVEFRFGEFAYLFDGELEFGIDRFQLLLLDAQHRCPLRCARIELIDIDRQLIAHFLADERLALFVVHGDEAHVTLLDLDFAVVEDTCERFVCCNFVHINQPAVTAQEIGAVTLAHFVGDLDFVLREFILFGEFDVDFGRESHLEDEFVFGIVVEVEGSLLVARQDVTHVVYLLLVEIFENRVGCHLVGRFRYRALAVCLVDDAHGHHSRTETRHVGLAAVFAQLLLHCFVVVGLADGNFDDRDLAFAVLSCDVHYLCV